MSNFYPEGEATRRAIRWISEQLKELPQGPVMKWVHEAIARFNLSPKEAEALIQFYRTPEARSGKTP